MRRMRRLRTPRIRDMVAETSLSCRNLVQPIFVDERASRPQAIASMPGQYRQSLESIASEAGALEDLGIPQCSSSGCRRIRTSAARGLTTPRA